MAENDDLRAFIREIMARFDRGMAVSREENRVYFETLRKENRRYFEVVDERTRDLLDESRAQRQALLAILDRLDNGGSAPAAG